MKEINIKIKEIEYVIKQSFRTYILFEEMTGKQVGDIETTKDNITLIYCTFKGCNKNFSFSFDEFIDLLDENPGIFSEFAKLNETPVASEKKSKKVLK